MLELPQKMRHWHRGSDNRAAYQRSPGPEVDGYRLDVADGGYPVVVDGIVGKCKTETSRKPVPIDELTTAELLPWRRETSYAEPDDWVFASERVQGKMPPWADTLLDRFLQPAAKRAGITKWVGFHTFRHTYSTLLKANGEDVKVVQELMRHANISTTMNIYTKALTSAKREAQSRVVDVLLDRLRNVVESAAEDAT